MNTRLINLLIAVFDLRPGAIAEEIEESPDSVSHVLNDKRPLLRVRRKICGLLVQKVYEAFGLEPEREAVGEGPRG